MIVGLVRRLDPAVATQLHQDVECLASNPTPAEQVSELDEAAQDALDWLAESDAELESAYRQRGICRAKLGQLPAAIQDFTRHLELDGDSPDVLLRRAEACFKVGRYHQAEMDCLEAAEQAPENWKVRCQLAMVYGTAADSEIRDGKQAVREASLANELSPGNAWECLFALATAHAENGDLELATTWQAQAVDAAPASQKTAMKQVLQLLRAGQPYRHRPNHH